MPRRVLRQVTKTDKTRASHSPSRPRRQPPVTDDSRPRGCAGRGGAEPRAVRKPHVTSDSPPTWPLIACSHTFVGCERRALGPCSRVSETGGSFTKNITRKRKARSQRLLQRFRVSVHPGGCGSRVRCVATGRKRRGGKASTERTVARPGQAGAGGGQPAGAPAACLPRASSPHRRALGPVSRDSGVLPALDPEGPVPTSQSS